MSNDSGRSWEVDVGLDANLPSQLLLSWVIQIFNHAITNPIFFP